MNIDAKVLSLLANCEFHSGELLAQTLSVSRATIWKSIQNLTDSGLDIYAVRGRGYRLVDSIELLSQTSILNALSPESQSSLNELDVLWEVDSTNKYLADLVRGGIDGGRACVAEKQTQGRGRRGKHWVSPLGGNIYLSLLWGFPFGPAQLSGLSLAIATTVVETLHHLGLSEIGVKWPNDILWRDRKLAGILLEIGGESAGPCFAIVGLGLNIQLRKESAGDIGQPWVDLKTIAKVSIERNKLVASLINAFVQTCNRFEQGGLKPFLPKWREYDRFAGKKAVLHLENESISGVIRGVDDYGALLLECDGKITRYHSGDVSLDVRNSTV